MPSVSVNVAYVGALGRKYPLSPDINYPVFVPGASTTQNVDSRRPIPALMIPPMPVPRSYALALSAALHTAGLGVAGWATWHGWPSRHLALAHHREHGLPVVRTDHSD